MDEDINRFLYGEGTELVCWSFLILIDYFKIDNDAVQEFQPQKLNIQENNDQEDLKGQEEEEEEVADEGNEDEEDEVPIVPILWPN